jgi:triacylglycerol lipase
MLAFQQKIVAIALLSAALAWAMFFGIAGHPFWGVAGALVVLFGHSLFLAAEFVTLYLVQCDDIAPRPSLLQLLTAWSHEAMIAFRVFLWWQPFRSAAEPDHLPSDCEGRPGVVLVHGFLCNRGLWNPWMRRLRAQNVPFIAVNLEPVFGLIDGYTEAVEAAVAQLEAATKTRVVLVGHSMGGIAIRAWLARFNAAPRVRRALTIASPHHGTWLGRFGYTVGARQLRLCSPWLAALAERETLENYALFTCFFGHCDNIVFPAACGTLAGAENIHLPGTPHLQMVFEPAPFDALLRWLR